MGQLEDMELFTEIVRANGITHAADRLNIAPSAVSRRLKDIEARLGVQLMNRTTRQMALTESGRTYLAHAERILADFEEANNDIMRTGADLSGTIRMSAPLSFGISHLAPAVAEFIQAHPRVLLEIDLSDRPVDLVQEGFDLALRIGNPPDSSLRGRKFGEERSVVAASPAFIERHGPFSSPADLEGLPGLLYTLDPLQGALLCRAADGSETRIRLQTAMVCNNGDLMADAATAGVGMLRVPRFIVRERLARGELVSLFPDHDFGSSGLHLLWPPTRHLSMRTRTLIDFLVDFLGKACADAADR